MQLSKNKQKFFSGIILGFIIITLFSASGLTRAQSVDDLQAKINQKDADIAKLEAEIAGYQTQLSNLDKQKTSLTGAVNNLALQRKKLLSDIAVTQKKIDKINLEIVGLNADIGSKQHSINTDISAISLGIKQTNELEQNNVLETILSANDFTVAWTDIDNLMSIREHIIETLPILQKTKALLEGARNSTIEAKNQLAEMNSKLNDQQKVVAQTANEKTKLLNETKSSEAAYQALIADRLAKKTAFEKELSDYESQLKFILDPSSLPKGGVLSWPMASILITNLFGKNNSGIYVTGSHNGVDFRATVGTEVKALSDGVVAGTGDTDTQCPGVSFGRFILIKYDDGLASTFGHLSLIKVKTGDRVTRGQVVGLSGYTGYVYPPGVAGAHLHVSIYARDAVELKTLPSKSCPGQVLTQPISAQNAYLNPLIYFPPTTSSMFKSTIVKPD